MTFHGVNGSGEHGDRSVSSFVKPALSHFMVQYCIVVNDFGIRIYIFIRNYYFNKAVQGAKIDYSGDYKLHFVRNVCFVYHRKWTFSELPDQLSYLYQFIFNDGYPIQWNVDGFPTDPSPSKLTMRLLNARCVHISSTIMIWTNNFVSINTCSLPYFNMVMI